MKIGVIGPLDSSQKIKEYLNEIDNNLEVKLYIREKLVDAPEVIIDCENECDGIIFTGCGVYESVKANYKINLPNVFVSRGNASIVKALWQVKKSNIDLNKFSIDVVDNEILSDSLYEIDFDINNVFSMPYSNDISEMDYAKWHIDLFESKKTDVMLTGLANVYNYLKSKGYPVFRLEATRPLIRVSYNELKSKYELNKAKHSQIGVEILSLVDYKESMDKYYSNMIKRCDLDKIIVEYVRDIQGSVFNFGRDEYIIFAHKGAIENDINYNKLFSLKNEIKSIGFSLAVGIGIGNTSYQAETNGYKALKRSLDSSDFDIFLIDENEFLKGPLGLDSEINYSLIASDEYTIDISKKSGLSCESISKIIAISNTRQSKIYDTKELATYLNISDRSARRILNKLVSKELARVCAKETSEGGGRPKNLVELLF